jgi:hypothetical protein
MRELLETLSVLTGPFKSNQIRKICFERDNEVYVDRDNPS